MKPTTFPEQTKTLGPPLGMTREECGELGVYTDGTRCLSLWTLTWRERLQVLFRGRVWLWVLSGYTQPPVALAAESPFTPRESGSWIERLKHSLAAAMLPALFLALAAPARAQAPSAAVESNLYAGTLTYLDHAYAGGFQVGAKLATLRLVMTLPLPGGLRLAARGDLTALGAIDPNAPDLRTSRTVEGYAALSWSRSIAGMSVGPAVMAGALVPTGDAFAWRYEPTYGAGLRLGRGRSWVYGLVGKDGASDEECLTRKYGCAAAGDWRPIIAGSIEFGRAAIVGDFVGGSIGRVRLGALVRLPSPGGN